MISIKNIRRSDLPQNNNQATREPGRPLCAGFATPIGRMLFCLIASRSTGRASTPTTEITKLIRQALNRMAIMRTSYAFKTISRYSLPKRLAKEKPEIVTAILYHNGFGAFISSPIWDQLSRETQAGLLIHEALRQIQFQYGFSDLDDEHLQAITATLVDRSPSLSVELESLMSPQLRRLCAVSLTGKIVRC